METRAVHGDLAAAAVLTGLGLYVIIETWGYPGSPVPGAPGPAFFPRLLALALVALSLVLAASALRSRQRGDEGAIRWEGFPKVGAVVALAVVYVTLLEVGEFYLTTPLLLAAVMAVMGERRAWVLVLVPVGFVVFVYVVFHRTFAVAMPSFFF